MKLLSIFYVLFLVNFSLYAEVDKVKQKKLIYALENDIIKFSDLPPQKIVKYDISKYLHDGSANSAEVLRVNRRDIYNITITPDGKYALISDHNTKGDYVTLKIDIKTKKVVKTFHENFSNIDISSDGNYLLTSNSDGVKLWNLKSGKLIKTIKTSSYGYISSISINSNGKYAITTHDGSRIVKYWNLKTGKLINSFSLKNSYIYSSEIAPDGKSMVAYVYSSVKYNSSVNSYNLDTKKLIKNIYNCKCRRETAGISPNLKQMYIVDHKKVDFINLKTSEVRSMKGQSGSTYTSLSSNGKFVINYNKKSIGIWNLDENKEHHTINMPVEKLKFDKAAIDPKGKFILFVDNTKNKMYKINISHINSLGIKEQKATNKKIKEYILTKGYIDYPENSISLIKALDGAIGETYEFEREMAENNFKKYNFRIRKSLKNAIIGSRHVPHTSTSYTNYDYDTTYVNGKAFHVTSKNTENYSSGGHSENVYGYQVIYEFKNQSKNYYLIELESKWTGYYTSYNTASYGAWSSKSGTYLTSNTKGSPSSYPYAFAIAPDEKVKYQFEAGENKPKDLVTKIVSIHKITKEYKDDLEKALNSTKNEQKGVDKYLSKISFLSDYYEDDRVALINRFLKDDKVKNWHKILQQNRDKIFQDKFINQVKIALVYDKDDYDKDFDNSVTVIIKTPIKMKVKYSTRFGKSDTVMVNKKYEKTFSIKNISKSDLEASIDNIWEN